MITSRDIAGGHCTNAEVMTVNKQTKKKPVYNKTIGIQEVANRYFCGSVQKACAMLESSPLLHNRDHRGHFNRRELTQFIHNHREELPEGYLKRAGALLESAKERQRFGTDRPIRRAGMVMNGGVPYFGTVMPMFEAADAPLTLQDIAAQYFGHNLNRAQQVMQQSGAPMLTPTGYERAQVEQYMLSLGINKSLPGSFETGSAVVPVNSRGAYSAPVIIPPDPNAVLDDGTMTLADIANEYVRGNIGMAASILRRAGAPSINSRGRYDIAAVKAFMDKQIAAAKRNQIMTEQAHSRLVTFPERRRAHSYNKSPMGRQYSMLCESAPAEEKIAFDELANLKFNGSGSALIAAMKAANLQYATDLNANILRGDVAAILKHKGA